MNTLRLLVLVGAGLLVAMPPQARADVWNQKTVFTFSQPVEIPGRVLPAGTYVFKLADSMADRNIVEVFNKDENHLYGIFLAIPDYHLKPADKPIITFTERAAGAPQAVKAWFYPGENYGHDFVYPRMKAMELAKSSGGPVPSMPDTMASNTTKATKSMTEPHVMAMKKAPLTAAQPNQQEEQIARAFTPPPAAATSPEPTPSSTKELPTTASSFPLIGLVGLLSLGIAASLRFVAARME